MEKVAIVDLGITKIDLVLASVTPAGNFAITDEMTEPVKICNDLDSDGLIKLARINESIEILKKFKIICDVNKVTEFIAVASPNIRNLKNHRSFFDEIYTICGFKFRILTTEEKLQVLYTGVINTLDVPKALAIEVAGGSVNLVYYNRRNVLNQLSLPFGSYTLTQMFQPGSDLPENLSKKMVDYVKKQIKEIDFLGDINPEFQFVGIGNAYLNVGMLSRKIKRHPLDLSHNYVATKKDVDDVFNLVKGLDVDKTRKIKGVSQERSDILVSGICIIKAFLDALNMPEVVISNKGVKEGLIFNFAVPITNEKPISDLLGYSLDTINAFYGIENNNAKQVGELALVLFRQLKVLHKLPRGYVKVLRIASIMHDCGKRIKFYDHEKNSFSIILNSDIYGATQREIVLAAFSSVCQDLNNFNLADWIKYKDILLEEDVIAVKKLAVIIRVAEALDLTKRSLVQDISCDVLGDSVIMKTIVTGDAGIEVKEAMKCGVEFKRMFNKNLEVL